MTSLNYCSICRKNAGTSFCPGCQAYFCDKDFKNHRGILIRNLNEIKTNQNDLQGKIKKVKSQKQPSNLFLTRIDEWQQQTIEKVKQTAQQVRQQITKVMNTKRDEITKEFQILTQDLEHLKETESVLEPDLTRLRKQIDQLDRDVEQFFQSSIIELNIKPNEQIIWDQMISIESKERSNKQHLQTVHLSVRGNNSHIEDTGHRTLKEPLRTDKQSLAAVPIHFRLQCDGHACTKCFEYSYLMQTSIKTF